MHDLLYCRYVKLIDCIGVNELQSQWMEVRADWWRTRHAGDETVDLSPRDTNLSL